MRIRYIEDRALRGFTLIELLCTIAIMSIIAAISYPDVETYINKDRLDIAAWELVNNLRYAKMYAISKNVTAVHVMFLGDTGDGEYKRYIIYTLPAQGSSMTLKDVNLPENVCICRYKSTFSRPNSENKLIFKTNGSVNPACTITLLDKKTGEESAVTLTIGYTRIMKVNQ